MNSRGENLTLTVEREETDAAVRACHWEGTYVVLVHTYEVGASQLVQAWEGVVLWIPAFDCKTANSRKLVSAVMHSLPKSSTYVYLQKYVRTCVVDLSYSQGDMHVHTYLCLYQVLNGVSW